VQNPGDLDEPVVAFAIARCGASAFAPTPSLAARGARFALALDPAKGSQMPNRMEKAASEVMGAVKSTKARLEGLTGVFQHLAREHGEVTVLLLRVKASRDPKVRAELFPKIRAELLAHEKAELTNVYPVFRQQPKLAAFAEEHEDEAGELEAAIAQVTATAYDDELWQSRFEELIALVTAHVKEEESEWFPAAEKALGKPWTEEVLPRYEAAKAKEMNTLG
jgi:hemerythrin superfamily protein